MKDAKQPAIPPRAAGLEVLEFAVAREPGVGAADRRA
jgi:hypothetical protein